MRTYEGRPLPRPHEEVVDQGLGFDLGTLMSRRRMLAALGIGAAGIGLAACGTDAQSGPSTSPAESSSTAGTAAMPSNLAEIPEETAGPYPGDGSNGPDVLEIDGVVRSDIRSSFGAMSGTAEGVPIALELTVRDLARDGAPFAGAAVYVWHCDREGRYSLYTAGATDQNYLRGVQIADGSGVVRFTSVFPACYEGRWPHVHFEVYRDRADITDAARAIATSQLAFPKDVCDAVYATPGYESSVRTFSRVSLTSDSVFREDGAEHQMATVTGDVRTGYRVSLPVGVDTRTAPGGGSRPGGRPR
ncbi:intradiol ring-cleavage dioxygenase [Tsukamurella ocularis]|uniref:intradiol ring-cleavage dioxygenase n=1 Tax=Tsukamurella ocularis TaxID=1970234 RepID=UPI00216717BF|nr:intradiol ring-cleavage dioxygenase [Tsukamurella ocularis]MCS3782147.1 protocatechuate 3,4-dioxygenase beta subunit [Tsukamurella ocularis]MCS3789693.1 protocatechuate 3,4-dioxygenase beta subunit [Tsukamurella ocularis]MCS3852840.1 protocatechuate 3,4-dioxygenase beta subunit [Tsukamurella ocularis]